ncbi:transposase [Xanthomonadaceae bacterium JHOS43]|nr:transposase [Xanthomonadaceae bacterium JHOS43]
MPRYRRYFRDGQTVFLTLATHGRYPWMADDAACNMVLASLRAAKQRHPFRHHAHVLLHDHLHLMISPYPGVEIPALIGCFKRAALSRLHHIAPATRRLWQPRYHDHIVRDENDFARHLDYLHFNPVKHGLAQHAGAWPWSSLAAWQSRGVYAPTWGHTPPDHMDDIRES